MPSKIPQSPYPRVERWCSPTRRRSSLSLRKRPLRECARGHRGPHAVERVEHRSREERAGGATAGVRRAAVGSAEAVVGGACRRSSAWFRRRRESRRSPCTPAASNTRSRRRRRRGSPSRAASSVSLRPSRCRSNSQRREARRATKRANARRLGSRPSSAGCDFRSGIPRTGPRSRWRCPPRSWPRGTASRRRTRTEGSASAVHVPELFEYVVPP